MGNGGGKPRAKLTDVARRAGVSAGTVSLVLSGKGEAGRIAKETQARIHEAASQLDYHPSLIHRSARGGRTRILSFYSSFRTRERGDLYMDRMSAAIEHAGGEHRYNVLVHCDYQQSPRETFQFLTGGFADGVVIFYPRLEDPLLDLLRGTNVPVVLVHPARPEPAFSTVTIDERSGLVALADALYDHGHRRVTGLLVNWPGFPCPDQRFSIVQARLRDRGIDLADSRIVVRDEDRLSILKQALQLPERPTALFAWHDRLAYDLLEACYREGLTVPEDISIVGVDGLVWPTKTPHTVTSVEVPLEQIAETAVRVLVRLLEEATGPINEFVAASYMPGTTIGQAHSSL